MLEIKMLPARQGDAIWICWGESDNPYRMIIDMGTEEVGKRIYDELKNSPETQQILELLVVTHVDRDHIGGVLTCLAEADPLPNLQIKDIWFNGFLHLSGKFVKQPDGNEGLSEEEDGTLEPMGPAQGERFSGWLKEQKWNREFNGGPVVRPLEQPPKTVTLPDDLKLTILGPIQQRLEEFIDDWAEEVEKALEKGTLAEVSTGVEAMGARTPPQLETTVDLEILAEERTRPDKSPANGSSIALLLEYCGRKILLAGDAFPDDLIAAIEALYPNERLKLDAFKLPHHGSKKNISKSLVKSVDCVRWLLSTDGTQHHHPDPTALARIIAYSELRPPNLLFNVPSKYNGWWDNEEWRAQFDYKTEYGTKEDGLTLRFE